MLILQQPPAKGVQVPLWREPTMQSVQTPRARRVPFPKARPAQAKPAGLGHIAESDRMHHQYRLSILQWIPGPARRNPTRIIATTCGRFHAVILQEAIDHVPHITDQFIAYTGNTDLAILLNTDTFEPDPAVYTFYEASTSKDTWGMVLLIVRGFLRRPSFRPPCGHVLLRTHPQNCGQET